MAPPACHLEAAALLLAVDLLGLWVCLLRGPAPPLGRLPLARLAPLPRSACAPCMSPESHRCTDNSYNTVSKPSANPALSPLAAPLLPPNCERPRLSSSTLLPCMSRVAQCVHASLQGYEPGQSCGRSSQPQNTLPSDHTTRPVQDLGQDWRLLRRPAGRRARRRGRSCPWSRRRTPRCSCPRRRTRPPRADLARETTRFRLAVPLLGRLHALSGGQDVHELAHTLPCGYPLRFLESSLQENV